MDEELKKMLHDLHKALSRFSLHEQRTIILHKFSRMPWEEILEMIQENCLALNSKNVATLLVEMLSKKMKKVTPKFSKIMSKIVLTEMQCHSTRRTWMSFEMQGEGLQEIPENLAADVVKKCANRGVTVKCHVMDQESMHWIIIEELRERSQRKKKKTKQGPEPSKYKNPIFIAAVSCEPYFFCSSKFASQDILGGVTVALGYEKCKRIMLSGKNVFEMTKCLKLKERGAAGMAYFQPIELQLELPVKVQGGLDFTGRNAKVKYVEEAFGESPPVLNQLLFKTGEEVMSSGYPELNDTEFHMSIRFKSNDVWETIKQTVVKTEAFTVPVPTFYCHAAISGRDQIKLKAK